MQAGKAQKIPVLLVTGFLGAGKTTLLNRLLKTPYLEQTGFIINEFGAVGIDNRLVETADESMVELMNGCLCCTIKGDLPDSIAALLDRARKNETVPLRRIIIETTGLADPAPIIQALLGTSFLQPFITLGNVLTVVDSQCGEANLDRFAEARRQIAFADKIIISKADIQADKTALRRLEKYVQTSGSTAEIVTAPPLGDKQAEEAFCEKLLANNLPHKSSSAKQQDKFPDTENGHKHAAHGHDINRHSAAIRAFVLTAKEPVPLFAAEHFAYLVSARYGDKILRFKGFIDTDASGANIWILQGVQGRIYPPQRFNRGSQKRGAAAGTGSHIVLIAEGAEEKALRDLWDSCRNIPVIDSADRAAIMDNPLAIPGLKF